MKILIQLKSFYYYNEIQIDVEKEKMWVNNKEIKIDINKFISRLFFITASWKNEYNGNLLDSEEFDIFISDGKNINKRYHGKGQYPINYMDFKNLLAEIENVEL